MEKTVQDIRQEISIQNTKPSKVVFVVGMGPGDEKQMTIQAREVLEQCDVIAGYTVYVDLLRARFPQKEFYTTPMKQEMKRCLEVLRMADAGKRVAMVCSGDAGVYGMASPILELAAEFPEVEVQVIAGVTAALSGSALLGAPLAHDFAVISLSDLLTPIEQIERRLRCAAEGDFAICLYNPSSKKRAGYLAWATDILLQWKHPQTLCAAVRQIGREGEESVLMTLKELREYQADMFTTIFIGNSSTREIAGRMVTPRGYQTSDSKISDSKMLDSKISEAKLQDSKILAVKTSDSKVVDSKIVDSKTIDLHTGNVWIAAGTTEGRLLAEYCQEHGIRAVATVVSEYGEQLLNSLDSVRVQKGAMDENEMVDWIYQEQIDLILDATHPYAKEASENIKRAAQRTGVRCIRCLRESEKDKNKNQAQQEQNGQNGEYGQKGQNEENKESRFYTAQDVKDAVSYLESTQGAIFLTTGTKELREFSSLPHFSERVFARVLSGIESIQMCQEVGLTGKHVIGMQGPFSKELNRAMFQAVQARWLVTKEAGKAGGFTEKIEAARELGMSVIVIGRPVKEEGYSVEECKEWLRQYKHNDRYLTSDLAEQEIADVSISRELYLIGTGMGMPEGLTIQAVQAIQESQAVFGAERLTEKLAGYCEGKRVQNMYQPEKIFEWLNANPQVQKAAVLLSGDVGFFSGAAAFQRQAKQEKASLESNIMASSHQLPSASYRMISISGISSLSYLCAKCGISWEDVKAVSCHGRDCDIEELMKQHKKVFLLLDKERTPDVICKRLCEAGKGNVHVWIGEKLSYPEETIWEGKAQDFLQKTFQALSVMLVCVESETNITKERRIQGE